MTAMEFFEKHYGQLLGWTVIGLAVDNSESLTWGLRLKKGKKEKTAWILCDSEGNGPGHLDIEDASA